MKSGLKLNDFKSACETSTSAKMAFLIAHFLLSASHQHILVVHLLPSLRSILLPHSNVPSLS